MKNKILIIDDDHDSLRITETALRMENLEVLTANDGLEGLRTAFSAHPDLVILDIMMPGLDGLEVCRRLRELSNTPILMLTALATTGDVTKGLHMGADDYVTNPFKIAELVARVHALLRRASPPDPSAKASILVHGNLMLDLPRHKVTVGGNPVDLTPTEFRLLSYLARNAGRVVPHQTILVEVWGPEYCGQMDYLRLYVRYLRQKIERDPTQPEIIKTERGVGYYLD
jgi:DNA-binding response OmpR family regulator